ncbi:serine hydrolase [Tamlana agarivorans]|uniref:Serine hydrolase n=1 Tax=Pseudotamlana agarivorans TaxID=481183 RepID=A0ACC5U5H1_9FLAO|nr:serine hydrolase [Tamlana agarivorans]MBU2949556.1 serine hydrolase [Tamlana agarivorans]
MQKLLFLGIGIPLIILGALYPIDGYKSTKIARLLYVEKAVNSEKGYRRIPEGALLKLEDIKLNLTSCNGEVVDSLLKEDPEFSRAIKRAIPSGNYSLTAVDMSDPSDLKYAAYRENRGYQPGSVGKLVVLNAFFSELKKLYPNSWNKRTDLMRDKRVASGIFGTGDHHTIPVYNIETEKQVKRKVVSSDVFSLYEWLDHMVSVSNNGAATVVFRETMLLNHFGEKYPELTDEEALNYFKETRRDTLTNRAHRVINQPLRDIGITEDEWKLGGMFTHASAKYVGRKGGSSATPKGLMKFLVLLEQGNLHDRKTSLEMKRLIYLTDRRIRYAQSPRLKEAAVYFKSGSFYKCNREKNPNCGDYQGNVFNYMNSVIIVEQPNGKKYMVCLMTNVLNKNSAWAHLDLANKIDRIINPDA